jgi:hypothetical protein
MRRFGRWAVLLTAALAVGCGTSRRPYAHDPLLRDGRGRWGDPTHGRVRDYRPAPEPHAPRPPVPLDLPTLEWEKAAD